MKLRILQHWALCSRAYFFSFPFFYDTADTTAFLGSIFALEAQEALMRRRARN